MYRVCQMEKSQRDTGTQSVKFYQCKFFQDLHDKQAKYNYLSGNRFFQLNTHPFQPAMSRCGRIIMAVTFPVTRKETCGH